MVRGDYSYRADPAVPSFPDERPLVLFDGDCALCSGSARLILERDRAGRFRLAPTRSALGRALLIHYGVDADDPSTMLLIEDGRAFRRSEAVLRIAAGLPPPFALASVLRLVPAVLRDRAYDTIARRRRRIRGETWCAMPADIQTGDRVIG